MIAGRLGKPLIDVVPPLSPRIVCAVRTAWGRMHHGGTMAILVVGSTKGGVGKTALATNIAAVLAGQGRDVLLIDGDEQGSAATFAEIRAELPDAAKFTTIRLQGAAIRQEMRQLRDKYAEIVI